MNTEAMNQSNEQEQGINDIEFSEFGFNELDSLQEQVALKNSAQKNETEPEWELTEEDAREIKESLGDNLDLLDMFDEQTKRENELSQEWDNKESKEYKFLEKLKPDEIQRIKRRVQEKTQEEINLEYSLAKMKQDLSQSQEKKQEVDLTFPAQKREFLSETLEIVDKGITENIKESLSVLDRLDAVEVQIAKKEKEIEKEFNAEQNKDSSSPSILDSKIDEALQEKQQEQQESHQKELEALQKEKETLQRNFEASIENLIKQGDVKDLLKNLQTLDEAFAKFLKKTKEECDLLAKQRIETLELTMQSESVKVVVSGFVKELHNNRKEVKEQSKELELQKECYQNLDKLQRECLKGNEKAKSELEQEMKSLEEKHPAFKENYPKFYEKLEQTLKEPQRRQEKQQENTRERSA